MIKKRFFIERHEIDLGDDVAFPLNFQCSKVASLEDVINNFTYSIKLPKTENNLSIIEQIQEVSNTSAYQCYYHDCTYFIDEIPLFDTYGRVRILRITDTIEVTVLFGNFTMFENLKLKKLKEGNNDYSMNDVLLWDYGLKANVSGYSGFGIGQFGNTVDYIPNLYAKRVLPWVSVRYLWDMCLDNNYTLNGDISDFLDTLVLPLTGMDSDISNLDDVISILRTEYIDIYEYTSGTGAWEVIFKSWGIITDAYRLIYLDTAGRDVFIVPVTGTYDFELSFNCNYNVTLSGNLNVMDENTDSILKVIAFVSDGNGDLTITMPIKLEGENRIYFKLDILTESEFHDPLSFSFINLSITLTTYEKTAFKLKYPINNNLPDISQSDYVKAIMQLFGLMVQVVEGVFYFFSFNDVYDNLSKAFDWSDSLVQESRHETFIDFASDTGIELGSANYLRYKPDADITDQYGDDYLSSSNQFIPYRDILINQIFSASHWDQFTDKADITFDTIQANIFTQNNDSQWIKTNEINQRICIKDNEKVTLNVPALFGEPNEYVVDNIGNPIEMLVNRDIFKFLNSGKGLDYTSLKANYWVAYSDILNNYKQVRLKFILTPLQIRDFRFDYPIYLKQFGRYFFVKKINNWDVNKVTEIDLIVL